MRGVEHIAVGADWPFRGLVPGRYGCILADPPWAFATWSKRGSTRKCPSHHYSVMSLGDIEALPVRLLAAPDCALVLWAVQAMVPQALDVMKAWGFSPKSMGTWAKQSKTGNRWAFGTGYVWRSAAEFYLFGTIGQPKSAVRDVRNLIVAPVREHSRKPDQMHADLERMFPGAAKCELFARQQRTGWEAWGNELPAMAEIAA
jgi:N6-adenosine-specific RNA methylase IME4